MGPAARTDALIGDGLNQYRTKQYQAAVQTFTQVLARAGSASEAALKALDCRAGAYEKLGRHNDALKDAYSMIKAAEKVPDGYLRAGKNLESSGKLDLALKLYRRGTRLCDRRHQNYELLSKMERKAAAKAAPPKAADILGTFPPEILQMIFSQLPFGALCKCLNVNRTWRGFLTAWPGLWQELDLRAARKGVRTSAVVSYAGHAQGQMRSAYMRGVELQSTHTLKSIARKNPSLRALHLVTGGRLRDSIMQSLPYLGNLTTIVVGSGVSIDFKTFTQIFSQCPNLVTAKFMSVWRSDSTETIVKAPSKLRSLAIVYVCSYRVTTFPSGLVSEGWSSLRSLSLVDECDIVIGSITPAFDELERLEVTCNLISSNQRNTKLPVRLKRLVLRCHDAGVRIGCPAMIDEHGTLQEIVLGGANWSHVWASHLLNHRVNATVEGTAAALRTFEYPDCGWDAAELASFLAEPRVCKLEQLNFAAAANFSDEHAVLAAEKLPSLWQLDLSRTPITGYGVRKLVESCRRLSILKLDQCAKIAADAVEWARQRGVRVSFSQLEAKSKAPSSTFASLLEGC